MKRHLTAAAGSLAAAVVLVVSRAAVGSAATGPAFGRVHHLQEVAKQRPFTGAELDELIGLASDKGWMI